MAQIYRNDEPSSQDQLSRNDIARSLANICSWAQPPIVVGVYGSWGIGKTSLMKIVEGLIEQDMGHKVHAVWFEAWRHEYDDRPALALVQELVESVADPVKKKELKKNYLLPIAGILTAVVSKKVLGLGVGDLFKIMDKNDKEQFSNRDESIRLQKYFVELIDEVTQGKERLVFFIDDLDRCMPDKVVTLLESIKLYLNHPNTVTYLGVDREVLERTINSHYKDSNIKAGGYLDKIIQLPFEIPPIANDVQKGFIETLLPDENLKGHADLLDQGLDRNPRGVKRFINQLILQRDLARKAFHPNPVNLTVLISYLLMKEQFKQYYQWEYEEPGVMLDYGGPDPEDFTDQEELQAQKDLYQSFEGMQTVMQKTWPQHMEPEDFEPYFTLTKRTAARFVEPETQVADATTTTEPAIPEPEVAAPVAEPITDLGSLSFEIEADPLPQRSDEATVRDEKMNGEEVDALVDVSSIGRFLTEKEIRAHVNDQAFPKKVLWTFQLLHTRKQRTWLVGSLDTLFMCLDDENTRKKERLIQWRMPLDQAHPIGARKSNRGSNVVDIGSRKGWLYSERLHPSLEKLVRDIQNLINQLKKRPD